MTIQNNRLNGINPLSYVGVNATQPPQVITANVAPTAGTKGYPISTIWIEGSGSNAIGYIYMGNDAMGDALWPIFTTGTSGVQTLSDTDGNLAFPTGAGDIQIIGDEDSGITVTSGVNSLTIGAVNAANVVGQTVDATPVVLYSFTVPASTGYAFEALVHGVKSDFTDAASFSVMRGIRRGPAGAPVLIGALSQQVCSDADPGVTCDVTVSGNDIQLTVTGLVATTYNWSAAFKWIQVI